MVSSYKKLQLAIYIFCF